MREIKFRIWNPRHNEYRYWGFIDGIFCGIPTGGGLTIEDCEKNSEQYTGLKDKNGKEIYKGDILQSEFTGEFDLVEWETDEDGSFLYSGWRCLSDGEYTEDRVVAGNIHENPELLNSEEEETGK